jgi:hypothetical protein
MELSSAVVNGLFLLLGVLISSVLSFYSADKERKWKEAMKDINFLSKQCEAFWTLEQSYLFYISQVSPKDKVKSVQSKRRLLLSINPKLEKITINPSSVNKMLSKWDLN